MAIDTTTEEMLSLSEAARALPALDGKRPHTSTIFRWMKNGCKGVQLDYVKVGHRIATSREALRRFMGELGSIGPTPRPRDPHPPILTERTPAQRERAIEQARRELAEA